MNSRISGGKFSILNGFCDECYCLPMYFRAAGIHFDHPDSGNYIGKQNFRMQDAFVNGNRNLDDEHSH